MKRICFHTSRQTPFIQKELDASIHSLPDELIRLIFKNFSANQDLAAISCVCKQWKKIAAEVIKERNDEKRAERIFHSSSSDDDLEYFAKKASFSTSLSNFMVCQIGKKLNSPIDKDEFGALIHKITQLISRMSLDNLWQLFNLNKSFIDNNDAIIRFHAIDFLSTLTSHANANTHFDQKYSVDQLQRITLIYVKKSIAFELSLRYPSQNNLYQALSYIGKLGGSKFASESFREICLEELLQLIPNHSPAVTGLTWFAISPYITPPFFQKVLCALQQSLEHHPKLATEAIAGLSVSGKLMQERRQTVFTIFINTTVHTNEIVRETAWQQLAQIFKGYRPPKWPHQDVDILKVCEKEKNPGILYSAMSILAKIAKQTDEAYAANIKKYLASCITNKSRPTKIRLAGLASWKAIIAREIKKNKIQPQEFVESMCKFSNNDQLDILDEVLSMFNDLVSKDEITIDIYSIYLERLIRLSQSSDSSVAWYALKNLKDIDLKKNVPADIASRAILAFLKARETEKLRYDSVAGLRSYADYGMIPKEFYEPVCMAFIEFLADQDRYVQIHALRGITELGFSIKSDNTMHRKCIDNLCKQSVVSALSNPFYLADSLHEILRLDWLPSNFQEPLCKALICLIRCQPEIPDYSIRFLQNIVNASHMKTFIRMEALDFLLEWTSVEKNENNRKELFKALMQIALRASAPKPIFTKCMQAILEASRQEQSWPVLTTLADSLFKLALTKREHSPQKCLNALKFLTARDGIDALAVQKSIQNIKELYIHNDSSEQIRSEAFEILSNLSKKSECTTICALGEIGACPHSPLAVKEHCFRELLRHTQHDDKWVRRSTPDALVNMILAPSTSAKLKKMCAGLVLKLSKDKDRIIRTGLIQQIENLLKVLEINQYHEAFIERLFQYTMDETDFVRKATAQTLGTLAGYLSGSARLKEKYKQALNNLFQNPRNKIIIALTNPLTKNYEETNNLNNDITYFIQTKLIELIENSDKGKLEAGRCLGAIAGADHISKEIRERSLAFLFKLAADKLNSFNLWCSVEGLFKAIRSERLDENLRKKCIECLLQLSKERHHIPRGYALEKLQLLGIGTT